MATNMTPKQALSNLMAALTGDDVLQSGLFIGTYRQHSVLQDSVTVLTQLLAEGQCDGIDAGVKPPDSHNHD